MRAKNLGVDIGVVEIDPEDMENTLEEDIRETNRKVSQIQREKENLEEVADTKLEVFDAIGTEERNAKALEILEKERSLQEERELAWIKEKKAKRLKRTIKLVLIALIVIMLFIAWQAGYRIPIPDEWVKHIQGIYETAFNAVKGYFTKQ